MIFQRFFHNMFDRLKTFRWTKRHTDELSKHSVCGGSAANLPASKHDFTGTTHFNARHARRSASNFATAGTAALLCFAFTAYWFGLVAIEPGRQDVWKTGRLISSMYDPPKNAIENALVKGDGQIFAGMATDPLAKQADMVRGGPSQQAFRYQRPMYGWLGWIASVGKREVVAWALVAITALSIALLVYAVAGWLVTEGSYPGWALLILIMPGVISNLTWLGPEALGVALITIGLKRWMLIGSAEANYVVPMSDCPDKRSIACFAAAGLCHESFLIVPLVLLVDSTAKRRLRFVLAAAISSVPYIAWLAFLRIRIGAWPKSSVVGRFSLMPFAGMLQASTGWGAADWFFASIILTLAAIALIIGRKPDLQELILVYLVIAATLGEPVWARFQDFGRVLLPLTVLSLVAVVLTIHVHANGRYKQPIDI